MKKILFSMLIGLMVGCSSLPASNPTAPTTQVNPTPTITPSFTPTPVLDGVVQMNWNNAAGCNLIFYIDSGSPQTISSSSGSVTLWSGVPYGNHGFTILIGGFNWSAIHYVGPSLNMGVTVNGVCINSNLVVGFNP